MQVWTTADLVARALENMQCNHQESHQPLEGQTKSHGTSISRTKYSEAYTRRFARWMAVTLQKIKSASAFVTRSLDVGSMPFAKRAHVESSRGSSRRVLEPTPITRTSETEGKRRRLEGKQPDVIGLSQEVFRLINEKVPRLGKVEVLTPEVREKLQRIMPGFELVTAVACRGVDRTLGPPSDLNRERAPFRRSLMILRHEGVIALEDHWEEWSTLPKSQVIRRNHACRLCVTVFGRPSQIEGSTSLGRESGDSPEEPDNRSDEREHAVPESCRDSHEQDRISTDVQSYSQPAEFRALHPHDRQWLMKAHKNLGHPSNEKLQAALREQHMPEALIEAAKVMRCSSCEEVQRPKLARPATLKDHLEFNDKIAIDELVYTTRTGMRHHIFHVIDYASSFHIAFRVQGSSSQDVIAGLSQHWLSWAGAPGEMIVDAATALTSEEFLSFTQRSGIRCTTIAPRAHWQTGKVERHGQLLEIMLKKYELDHGLDSDYDVQQALWHLCQAKNSLGMCRGFSPEMIVPGKSARLPASNMSDTEITAHSLAEAETLEGLSFKELLARRETARKACHEADNHAAIRRATLRRSRPARDQYAPGEWVMMFRPHANIPSQGAWFGPLRVMNPGDKHNIWATVGGKIFRGAPEHVRPVSACEARQIPELSQDEPRTITSDLEPIPQSPSRIPVSYDIPPRLGDQRQPDPLEGVPANSRTRPEVPSGPNSEPDQECPPASGDIEPSEVPLPEDAAEGLLCPDISDFAMHLSDGEHLAWKTEILINDQDIEKWKSEESPSDLLFIADAAKKQRSEVKLSELGPEDLELFRQAKDKEIQNWLSNKAVERIARNQLSPEQILRCRWILTWKPLDPTDIVDHRTHKAKARLVVLGYLDPKLDEVPRDSPTLGRQSRMLILQLIASCACQLQSFDIKAAFLQGRPQAERVIGLDPVPELAEALKMKPDETLRLVKGAYGLVDAPFLSYCALKEKLIELQFEIAPWDPCVFVLRNPKTLMPDGVIGVHVDDGLCGGNDRFQAKLKLLEAHFAFGSHKRSRFCFTGIDLEQRADYGIVLSQSAYIRKINAIKIDPGRKTQPSAAVTEAEKRQLRAIIGSLQYASVHTRPDLSSGLSMLQSAIPKATIATLVEANRVLHEAKRFHDTCIVIQPIPLEEVRFLAFSDASFASAKNPDSHAGSIILAVHADLGKNLPSSISPLTWSSRKIQKVVTSTLAAEAVALNSTLDQLSWIRLYWAWLIDNRVKWKTPREALEQLPSSHTVARMPESLAATDCKSLYDLVTRNAPPSCAEFRTQLHARAIKDLLSEGVAMRWVHSSAQLADSLTKLMSTAMLRETLAVGKYCLSDESEILKERSNRRDRIKWLRNSTHES